MRRHEAARGRVHGAMPRACADASIVKRLPAHRGSATPVQPYIRTPPPAAELRHADASIAMPHRSAPHRIGIVVIIGDPHGIGAAAPHCVKGWDRVRERSPSAHVLARLPRVSTSFAVSRIACSLQRCCLISDQANRPPRRPLPAHCPKRCTLRRTVFTVPPSSPLPPSCQTGTFAAAIDVSRATHST